MLDYALEVEHFDHHLQRMLNELDSRGMLNNTLVVVTADNGMPFPRIKGQEYEMSNHLPLAIMWADGIKRPGRTIDELVSFIDLAPTYMEIAGIDWSDSGMAPTPGKSLTPFFGDSPKNPHRQFLLIGKERHDVGRPNDIGYPIRGIIQGPFLLIRNYKTDRWPAGNPRTGYLNTDGSPTKTEILNARREGRDDTHWQLAFGLRPEYEMFNIETDRECLSNIAEATRYAEVRAQMARTMTQSLQIQGDPRALGNGDVFDEYPYANARERNFYSQYIDDPTSVRAGWVNPSDFETSAPESP
jgi:arylsulfatase A-like enzyme